MGAGGADKNRIYEPDKGYWQETKLNRARRLLMDFNISKSNQGELIRNKSSIKETTTRVENQPSSLSPSPGNESFCFPQPSLRNV